MPVGRKLLIIDINEMLLHRVHKKELEDFPTRPKHLARITAQHHVFLRPYANVFLKFCVSHFAVILWSSAQRNNIEPCLRAVLPEQMTAIHGLWCQDMCERRGQHPTQAKPLIMKPLQRIWDMYPQFGPHNTVILDDDAAKVACNPADTAVHPRPWQCNMTQDRELSERGEVGSFVRRLLEATDTRQVVRDNPLYGAPTRAASQ